MHYCNVICPLKQQADSQQRVAAYSTMCCVQTAHCAPDLAVLAHTTGDTAAQRRLQDAAAPDVPVIDAPTHTFTHITRTMCQQVTRQHNDDCKKLLRLMGVPVIDAPTEAEAQCAAMAKAGLVYGVATEDMDCLTFGAPK